MFDPQVEGGEAHRTTQPTLQLEVDGCFSELVARFQQKRPPRLTVYDVVGKSLLDKVADAADTAKQLAAGAMAGDISIKDKLEFNDEAGLSSDIDVAT